MNFFLSHPVSGVCDCHHVRLRVARLNEAHKIEAVVGSAQGFLPQSVIDALNGNYRTDGIMLKQASE